MDYPFGNRIWLSNGIALFKILIGLLAAQVAMKEAAARDIVDKMPSH